MDNQDHWALQGLLELLDNQGQQVNLDSQVRQVPLVLLVPLVPLVCAVITDRLEA